MLVKPPAVALAPGPEVKVLVVTVPPGPLMVFVLGVLGGPCAPLTEGVVPAAAEGVGVGVAADVGAGVGVGVATGGASLVLFSAGSAGTTQSQLWSYCLASWHEHGIACMR